MFEEVGGTGVGRHEGMEFVDDDDEAGWRVGEVVDRGATMGGEQSLTARDLRPNGDERAEGGGGVEVVEDAVGVRRRFKRREGGSSLEVDEDERDLVGRVLERQAQEPGLEEKRLPAPVVPATRAWGPSRKRSMLTVPAGPLPTITGRWDRAFHRPMIDDGESS